MEAAAAGGRSLSDLRILLIEHGDRLDRATGARRTADVFDLAGDCRRVALYPGAKGDLAFHLSPGEVPSARAILDAATQDGWVPDCVLVALPEYIVVPEGLFELGVPVVAYLCDWHLWLSRIVDHLRLYDLVLTDRFGVGVLEARGLTNCRPVRLYTAADYFDHDASDVADRPIDVVFVANLGRRVHTERARWVYRLAKLVDRGVRVQMVTLTYGEEAARWTHSAKMVFNRSIRREASIRCYEALAAGCVLLCEEENQEVSDFLVPGVDFMPYGESDFEEVVAGLLSDPDRLTAIASAGQARYRASETIRHRAASLAEELCALADRVPLTRNRVLALEERAHVLDQQTWVEGLHYHRVAVPLVPEVVELLNQVTPGEVRLANALANGLAQCLVIQFEGIDLTSLSADHLARVVRELAPKLYSMAAAGGWLTPRMNALMASWYLGDHGEVVRSAPPLVAEIESCSEASRLEGPLLIPIIEYRNEFVQRESIVRQFGLVSDQEYLVALRGVSVGIVRLLEGAAHAKLGNPDVAIGCYLTGDKAFPVPTTSAKEAITSLAYEMVKKAEERSDPESGYRYASICIAAAEEIMAESILSLEEVLLRLHTCYLITGHADRAVALADEYQRLTECIAGAKYRANVESVLGYLRAMEVEIGGALRGELNVRATVASD